MKTKRLIVLFLLLLFAFSTTIFAENSTNEQDSFVKEQSFQEGELKLYCDSAILIDNRTGKTLYEKNSKQKMYPASTTKILNAILVLEKGNLNDTVTVSKEAIAEMKSGYTSAYLSEGEVISVEDLLKVLLIHSANDAANVLAEYISGSINEFVNLMNNKAYELGCTNTHFVTTNGLHDDNHYTTAEDLATITRYCMQNPTFRKIVSTTFCTISATNKSEERIYKNTNDLIIPTSNYYYEGCIGVKTGYTSQAKNCLISAVNKDGKQMIAVVLGANLTDDNRSARYVDSITLFDYGFSNFSNLIQTSTDDVTTTISAPVTTNTVESIAIYNANDDIFLQNKITSSDIIFKRGLIILLILMILTFLFIGLYKMNKFKKN